MLEHIPFCYFATLLFNQAAIKVILEELTLHVEGARVQCVVPLAKAEGCELCGSLMEHAKSSSSASDDKVPPSPSIVN